MGSQQFCLRWNNHQTNMLSVFDQLLQSEDFVDVTLACEGLSIKAHKVVLSACSPYFQSLFKENPCKHPIVILKDMKYTELRSIVDFMYKGEINVSQDQLSTLLKTAEALKVKGLAEVSSGAVPHSLQPHSNHESGENGGGDDTDGGEGGTVSSIADDMVSTQLQQQRQNASSPMSNEDGRASPHSRRKRHRPMRRPSNDDSMNPSIESSEICFEPIGDTDPKLTPKTEPIELLSEPPIELLMDTNPNYDLEMSTDRTRIHDTLTGLSSDGLSQPSTSGTQLGGQACQTMDSDETPWERKRRLNRERARRWRARQSQETLDRLRQANAAAHRLRIQRETPQQSQARRAADSNRRRSRSSKASDSQQSH